MRAAHAADPEAATAGVDVVTGGVGDMRQVRRQGPVQQRGLSALGLIKSCFERAAAWPGSRRAGRQLATWLV